MTKHQRSALWTLLAAGCDRGPLSAQATQGPRARSTRRRAPRRSSGSSPNRAQDSAPLRRATPERGSRCSTKIRRRRCRSSGAGSRSPRARSPPRRGRAPPPTGSSSRRRICVGVPVADLRFLSAMESGPIRAFRWQQMSDGLEVQGASWRSSSTARARRFVGILRDRGGPGLRARARLTAEQAQAVVARDKRLLAFDTVETRDLVIFGARKNGSIEARLAFAVEVSRALPADRRAGPGRRRERRDPGGAIPHFRLEGPRAGLLHGATQLIAAGSNADPPDPWGDRHARRRRERGHRLPRQLFDRRERHGAVQRERGARRPRPERDRSRRIPATAQGDAPSPDGNGGYVASLDPNPAPGRPPRRRPPPPTSTG